MVPLSLLGGEGGPGLRGQGRIPEVDLASTGIVEKDLPATLFFFSTTPMSNSVLVSKWPR